MDLVYIDLIPIISLLIRPFLTLIFSNRKFLLILFLLMKLLIILIWFFQMYHPIIIGIWFGKILSNAITHIWLISYDRIKNQIIWFDHFKIEANSDVLMCSRRTSLTIIFFLLLIIFLAGNYAFVVLSGSDQIPDHDTSIPIWIFVNICFCCAIVSLFAYLSRTSSPPQPHRIDSPNIIILDSHPMGDQEEPLTPSPSSSEGNEENTCMICHRHFDPEKREVVLTDCCQHLLHADCQVQWLAKKDACPFPYCEKTIID